MRLSIVTTLYYSSPYINEFYNRITASVQKITDDYEIIFVNDGSPDNSLNIVLDIHKKDKKVNVIDLSRNFGHHKAIMTGLAHVKGEYVFLIDSDLEEEPEFLELFWKELSESKGYDVIYGVQKKRKGGFIESVSGRIFYWIYNLLSSFPIPKDLITCRLMTKRYVQSLISYREQEIFLAGLWQSVGFSQKALSVLKKDHSKTTYTLGRKVSIAVNSITSFSNKPLIYIFYLGVFITIVSVLFILNIVVKKIVNGIDVEGWTSIIASIWLLGGVIIFSVGIIGIYLSKIFTETKNRPYTIIKHIYNRE